MKIDRSEVLKILPDLKQLQLSPIYIGNVAVAYQSSAISDNGYCLGTGFDYNPDVARLKALSESMERRVFEGLFNSELASQYLLHQFPTSCGFSFGFDEVGTKVRAAAEAIERWIRSKWIDDCYALDEVPIQLNNLNCVESWLLNHFKSARLFQKSLEIDFEGRRCWADSKVIVCYTELGAFVGSKTTLNCRAPLLHALVEAWRHLRLSYSDSLQFHEELKTIKFFANNRSAADAQIERAKNKDLPNPKFILNKKVDLPVQGFYCSRILCDDFIGWHGNDYERFVY